MADAIEQSIQGLIETRDRGDLSPEQLIEQTIDNIDKQDNQIGAFCCINRNVDTMVKQGPLSGICVGIKDILDTHDLPTEYGSPAYRDYRPNVDSAIVAMLRAQGAAIIGKTTTTEFAFMQPTQTKNPHNIDHTPGGSSAGSAAAVAAGMVPVAIGTQTGGSVIRPASFCGVAALKPSFRLLPTIGMKYFSQSLDTLGVFAKSIADIGHFTSLMTGRSLTIEEIDPSQITIGIYRHEILEQATPQMCNALEIVAQKAQEIGFTVIDAYEPEELTQAHNIHHIIQNFEAADAMAGDRQRHDHLLSETIKQALDNGADISPQTYDRARRTAKFARKATGTLFSQFDAILTPSSLGAAPYGLATTGDPIFNKLWTLLGSPAINIPGMYDEHNMPLGIQLIGRFGRDQKLIQIAHRIEQSIKSQPDR